jgi:tetratricopeptide (TPR) repeat protein
MRIPTISTILSREKNNSVLVLSGCVLLFLAVTVYLCGIGDESLATEVAATVLGSLASLLIGIVIGHTIRGHRQERLAEKHRIEEVPYVETEPFEPAALMAALTAAEEPLRELVSFVAQTREAEARYDGLFETGAQTRPPHVVARYLASELEATGLVQTVDDMEEVRVAYLPRSKKAYFTFLQPSVTWEHSRRLLQIEAAVNRAFLVNRMIDPRTTRTVEAVTMTAQVVEASITAQLPSIAEGIDPADRARDEWGVRHAIATGIETLQSPYRIEATYRVNTAENLAAFELKLPEPELFSTRYYATDAGRVVEATRDIRRREATVHGAQLGVLLAAYVFAVTESIDEVWINASTTTPKGTECAFSVSFDRDYLAQYDLHRLRNPLAVLEGAGAAMDVENGAFRPVAPGFSLRDERLCPAWRSEPVSLSTREIPADCGLALGARDVHDLAIRESDYRMRFAEELSRLFSDSAEHNVHVILEKLAGEQDESVQEAGKRSISNIIDGKWENDAAQSLLDEFAQGDDLTVAVSEAVKAMLDKDMVRAESLLSAALAREDAQGRYVDDETTVWRAFDSYVQRSLYNRLLKPENVELRLVPESYYNAWMLLASARIVLGDDEGALAAALRAQELCPMGTNAALRCTRAYENLGQTDMAFTCLVELLSYAHDPETIGVAYYRLAFMAYKLENYDLALACYARSTASVSSVSLHAHLELVALEKKLGRKHDPAQTKAVLAQAHIPLAPTDQVADILVECAQASVNAGIFPAARQFTSILSLLSGDDVMAEMAASFEGDPEF